MFVEKCPVEGDAAPSPSVPGRGVEDDEGARPVAQIRSNSSKT